MGVSFVSELARMGLGLGLVAACIWALGRLARRRGGRAGMFRSAAMEVVARQPLAKGVSLVAVKVGERVLLLGVSSGRVTRVAELEADAIPLPAANDLPDRRGSLAMAGRYAWRDLVAGYRTGSQGTAPLMRGASPATAWTSSRLERLREMTIRRG